MTEDAGQIRVRDVNLYAPVDAEAPMKVYFARINRRVRRDAAATFDEAHFQEDVLQLAESRRTTFEEPSTVPDQPRRTWFAGDFTRTPDGSFLTGILGYSENRVDVEFDLESWTWTKGVRERRDSGSQETMAPFAINLDPDERWVAYATTPRLQRGQFRVGLQRVLAQAALDAGMLSAEWEVDPVTSEQEIRRWIRQYPKVRVLRRTVKFSNPGRELDEDEDEMAALAAGLKTESFSARRGQELDTSSDVFESKIQGVGEGNLEVYLESRLEGRKGKAEFKSEDRPDSVSVPSGVTIEARQDIVLGELVKYRPSKTRDERSE